MGLSNSFAILILAFLAPILGTLADYLGYKKKFFSLFFDLGGFFTALLSAVPGTSWPMLLTGKTNNGGFGVIILFIIGGAVLVKVPQTSNSKP